MKRFDYDDEDFQDDNLFPDTDDDDYDDDEEEIMDAEEYAEMMRRQEALTLMQLDLVEYDLNQRLLFKAIKLARKSTWFWSLRSKVTQMRAIATAYLFLKSLVIAPQEEEKKDA